MFRCNLILLRSILVTLAIAIGSACSQPETATARATEADTSSPLGARIVPTLRGDAIDGVNVWDVDPNGPVARLALRDGDHIAAVDGQPLHSTAQVSELVARIERGERPNLAVEHEGARVVIVRR